MTAELTRRDVLLARGWVECETCGGRGSHPPLTRQVCPACVDGLVPPPHKVESIARAEALGRKKLTEHQVRTVLIEDARRMKP